MNRRGFFAVLAGAAAAAITPEPFPGVLAWDEFDQRMRRWLLGKGMTARGLPRLGEPYYVNGWKITPIIFEEKS